MSRRIYSVKPYNLSEQGKKMVNTQVTQNASGEPVYANFALQVHDNPGTILPAICAMTITPFSLLTRFSETFPTHQHIIRVKYTAGSDISRTLA